MEDIIMTEDNTGITIKSCRHQRGVSQLELARRLEWKQQAISRIESTDIAVSARSLARIAEQLGFELILRPKN